jgi:hypothetical protein
MCTGSLAKSQKWLTGWTLVAAGLLAPASAAFGQSFARYENSARRDMAARQALYESQNARTNGQSAYVDAYGNSGVMPAGYCESCDNGYGSPSGGCPAGCYPNGCCAPVSNFGTAMPMGAGGTDPPIGYDLMDDVGIEGDLVDQRGPHYWDVRAEAVFLRRDETFGRNIAFTTDNVISQTNPPVLTSNQLNYGTVPGFRVLGRYDILPLAVLEFGYTGLFGFEDSAKYTDQLVPPNTTPDLFSLFSEFGTNPANVTTAGGPMPESERAQQHSISIESDLQTAEMTYRRYWLGWHPSISGTLLAGFRYTRLTEEFEFSSIGGETIPFSNPVNPALPTAGLDYTVDAENNLAGFQTGGDIWICLMQGLRFGTEGKVGLYDNRYKLVNEVVTNPIGTTPPTLFEKFDDDKTAFIGEFSLDLVADVLPSVSVRVGYELLFINSLVLAGDNFNTGSPYNRPDVLPPAPPQAPLGPLRIPFVDDNGQAFYQGGHIGIEYIW